MMDPTLLLLLACGYAAGLLVWPWRQHMGGARPGEIMDGRLAWSLMFSMLWPFMVAAAVMAIASAVWHRR